ncbi:uncharacterized protein LOC122628316 [Vespula pensylvanica]|uniref:uncharacterized protein LOC122628316 n=1 Tax=Vespula pensylvanica TaxID=30213 RepID=UPI001CBA12AC|nr:uncharacterized protein LOC122628316 [Vespula pensylvanica]
MGKVIKIKCKRASSSFCIKKVFFGIRRWTNTDEVRYPLRCNVLKWSKNERHQYPMLAQEAPASAKIRLRVTPTDGSSKQDTLRPNRKIEENAAVKCLRVVVEVQAKARLPHELIILLGVELHGRMRVEWSRGRVCVSCNAEQRGKK